MQGDERRSQSHAREYSWLGKDLTRNTGGRYTRIFQEIIVMLTSPGHNHYRIIYYRIPLAHMLF